jgi:hypothetical protein
MKKLLLSVICVTLFASCKDDIPPGGHHIRCLEKTSLRLKSDATPFEVKGYIQPIVSIEINGKVYENPPFDIVYRNGLGHSEVSDTMAVEWIEVYRIDKARKLKVKPQPNTTGAERSLIINLWDGDPGYYDTSLTVTQPSGL